MIQKIFAGVLFLYAAFQLLSFPSTWQIRQSQALAQLLWAILAVAGGAYLWKRSNK